MRKREREGSVLCYIERVKKAEVNCVNAILKKNDRTQNIAEVLLNFFVGRFLSLKFPDIFRSSRRDTACFKALDFLSFN